MLRRAFAAAVAWLCVSAIGGSPAAVAQSNRTVAPVYDEGSKSFRLDSPQASYRFGVDEQGELVSVYWGAALAPTDKLPQPHTQHGAASFDPAINATPLEYMGWGGGAYVVPDLKISFADGNRDLALRYQSYKIDERGLTVILKDVERAVTVELRYEMDAETGILGRSARIVNQTSAPIVVEEAQAATWNLPADTRYRLFYLTGDWAGEWKLRERAIDPGKTVLESRRGTTGHENNPWFAIARGSEVGETNGPVWFGALAWSGNWQIAVEQGDKQAVRVTGGYNNFDFGYRLKPGEALTSPVFYAGFTDAGMGEASRLMHRFERHAIVPELARKHERPVLYNSWEATGFNVDEAGQLALAEKAARIGVERFVMDDGWFGARNLDNAGLGDWVVNPKKFPHGLKPLIDRVHALGMDFGLWVEPEMVNPDSDLYRAHPDWVLNFTGRPRTEERNQLVLNLARPDVRAYVFNFLDRLLNENQIAFLKWDYNRNWSEPGWPAVAPEEQKKVYVEFIRNLYSILDELRARHPGVEIESCSGGGGRVDLGILGRTDEVWTSDNTDPFDRLAIQYGISHAYEPGVMMAWVTDSPNWVNNRSTSLVYRFLSSMQGGLGIGANLNGWKDEDFATAKGMIGIYKEIRATVQRGELHRLIAPTKGSEAAATESLSADKSQAVVFAFLHASSMLQPYPRLYLEGLDATANYRVKVLSGKVEAGTPEVASGAYWMHRGIGVDLRGDFQASLLELNKE